LGKLHNRWSIPAALTSCFRFRSIGCTMRYGKSKG